MALETSLLVVVIVLGANTAFGSLHQRPLWAVCLLLVILAGAMGLQTATLTRIGPRATAG